MNKHTDGDLTAAAILGFVVGVMFLAMVLAVIDSARIYGELQKTATAQAPIVATYQAEHR